MARKVVCDGCGIGLDAFYQYVEEIRFFTAGASGKEMYSRKDFCDSCMKKLREILGDKEE